MGGNCRTKTPDEEVVGEEKQLDRDSSSQPRVPWWVRRGGLAGVVVVQQNLRCPLVAGREEKGELLAARV